MSNIELRMPDSLVKKLDIVGAVDELTRGEVIRQACREWIEELDWKWYVKQSAKLEEDGPESGEDSDIDENSSLSDELEDGEASDSDSDIEEDD